MIELIALTSQDWIAWRVLRLRALADSPRAFGSTLEDWQSADEARWRARLELPDSRNLVACIAGEPVGMVTCARFENRFELIGMWVEPQSRGRGVGDALIEGACRWARERGANAVCLDVKVDNSAAVELYVRHGFLDVGAAAEAGERTLRKPLPQA